MELSNQLQLSTCLRVSKSAKDSCRPFNTLKPTLQTPGSTFALQKGQNKEDILNNLHLKLSQKNNDISN